MMKFFRKYTKHLLAVFMSLLLFVWLAPAGMCRSENTGEGEMKGTAFGEEVRLKDMRPLYEETHILDLLGVKWKFPWMYVLDGLDPRNPRAVDATGQVRRTPLPADELYMLDAAARHRGLHVSREAVERSKKRWRLDAKFIQAVHDREKRLSYDAIDRAIQSFVRVVEDATLAGRAVKVSEADIQDVLRDTGEKVNVSVVVVSGERFVDSSYQPAEAELREQFDKHKNTASRPSMPFGGQMEFGYQSPEAVQIESIRVNVEALIGRQKVSDSTAYEYWLEHESQFLKPATQPATSSAPTSAPKPLPPVPYKTFTEAKPRVLEALQRDKANEEALRIAYDLIGRLSGPWATAPATQPGNYRQPPVSETTDSVYPSLIASLEGKYPGVLTYGRTKLLTREELGDDPDLGGVMALAGSQQQCSVPEAAFMVAGLEADPQSDPQHARFFRNVFETCVEPFIDTGVRAGDAYVVRTVAARPKQAPASMDEVREQLVRDVRTIRGHEEAQRQARALADAVTPDLLLTEAFKANAELRQRLGDQALHQPKPFSRKIIYGGAGIPMLFPNPLTGEQSFGYDADLVELCFSLGAPTTTQPARTQVHEQKSRGQWLVVQWLGIEHVTEEEYKKQRGMAAACVRSTKQIELLKAWFAREHIRARVDWKDPPGQPPEPEEQEREEVEF